MARVLLDTDILSEIIKKKDAVVEARAAEYLTGEGRFTLSVLSVMEIVYGFHRLGREDRIKQFGTLIAVRPRNHRNQIVLTADGNRAALRLRVTGDRERNKPSARAAALGSRSLGRRTKATVSTRARAPVGALTATSRENADRHARPSLMVGLWFVCAFGPVRNTPAFPQHTGPAVHVRFYLDPETGQPHIHRHEVDEAEVEDVLRKPGEDRRGYEGSRVAMGQTKSGRYLRVIYVPDPEPDSVFVITAYDLTGKPLAAYRRRRKKKQTR